MIERCASLEQLGRLELRQALWPHCSLEDHLAEMGSFIERSDRYAEFVAYGENGQPIGFAEASLRTDYVNGTNSTPVAFLEGLYVVPEARRQGVAAELVAAVAEWAVALAAVNSHLTRISRTS
jgi:aminoglycoside 6'-N-acetyltransferase I